jgi:glutamyl-tRNA reductase
MLAVLGASHHDLGLTRLAALTDDPADLQSRIDRMAGAPGSPIAGAVLLATCNRLEVYLDALRFHDAVEAVIDLLAAGGSDVAAPRDRDAVAGMLQVRVGTPVAAHLFTVASGLDSMVVGEAEISGQVAAALRHAQTAGTATPTLNLLFQSAARTAKRVTSTTGLGSAGRSVASVALEVAEPSVGDWATADVLLIGTGSFARVVVAALKARGCARIRVFSASGRAQAFAAARGLKAIGRVGLADALAEADLVVTASGTGTAGLSAALLGEALERRAGRTLPVIDLALRPDVPAEARGLPGLELIDLHSAAERAGGHATSIQQAAAAVMESVEAFDERLATRTLDPAVVALREHVATTVQRELDRLRSKVPPELAAELDHAAHRMTRSLLHTPTVRARALARTGSGEDYLRAVHTLFGIDVGAGIDVGSGSGIGVAGADGDTAD